MKDHCEFPAFEAHRIQENIIHIELKKVKKLTAQDVQDIYECYEKCGGKNGVFVIVSFRGFFPLSVEAMDESKRLEKLNYINAAAYVLKSSAFRLGIKFFMNFYKPKYSTDIFATQKEALNWILKEKKKQDK